MSETPPTPAPTPPPRDDEEIDLSTPLLVSIAAAILAIAGAFLTMIGIQLSLTFTGFRDWALLLVVAYFLVGPLALFSAILMAKGRSAGALLGLLSCLLILGLCWTPVLLNFVALSMFGAGAFAAPSVLLTGVSIPITRKLEARRKAFYTTL